MSLDPAISTLLSVAALHVLVLVIPGPDVLLVSQTAVARSRRAALLAGAGVVGGIACWAALALLGINVLFQNFAWIHGVIRVAGGAYLLFMAFNLWRSSFKAQTETAPVQTPLGDVKAFRSGFLKRTHVRGRKRASQFTLCGSGLRELAPGVLISSGVASLTQFAPAVYSVIAVFLWGAADFAGGYGSRRANAFVLTAFSHVCAFALNPIK